MATNLVKRTEDTPIVWADTTDYSSTISGLARTDQLDLTSVGAGAARQGAKHDFGAIRASRYAIAVAIEFASGALSGEEVEFYHAGSPSPTAGNANPGGTSGVDAAYTGTAGDSLADSLKQLQYLGSLVTTADNTTTVQYQIIGFINGDDIPQYGMPVVFLNTTGAHVADAVEAYVAYIPINEDIQAAA